MNQAKIVEQNVKNSFHFVRSDISMLEQEHKKLLRRIAQLERTVERLQAKENLETIKAWSKQ
jgi:prefoldin subunit 5